MVRNLIENIKESEGFVEHVYNDTLGIPTIGYGFAVKDLILDEDIAEQILLRKVKDLAQRVQNKFDWFNTAPDVIKEVVVEMCYQLGLSGFSKFKKTISYLERKNYLEASKEMLDSKWAKQTPNRAKKLSKIVKSA
jgi:lysozyme